MQQQSLAAVPDKKWDVFRRPLAATFVLAFVLRAAPIVYLEVREPGWHANHIEDLEFYYDDVGRSLMIGKGFVHSVNPRPNCIYGFKPGTPFDYEPPFYACWIGAVYALLGPNLFAAKILQCLMDSCTCILLYVLCRRVSGERNTALLAALLYAVYPLAIVIGLHLYYQVPLNLIAIWLVLCLMGPATLGNGLSAGIAVGLSALVQPVTLPLLAVFPLARLVDCVRRKTSVWTWLSWSFVFAAVGVAVLTPWTVRNYLLFHRFVPIRNGAEVTMLQGSTDRYLDMDTSAAQEEMRRTAPPSGAFLRAAVNNHVEHLRAAPLDYVRFLARKFVLAWYNTESKGRNRQALLIQSPFLVLAILGLFAEPRVWLRSRNWCVPAAVLYFCAVEMAFLPLLRYTLPVMPLVMVIGAVGGIWLLRRTFGRQSRTVAGTRRSCGCSMADEFASTEKTRALDKSPDYAR